MKLKRLVIDLQNWGSNKGKYTGTIEYEGESGTVNLTLTPDISNRLLATCADQIVACSTVAAEQLRDAVQLSIAEAKSPALTA